MNDIDILNLDEDLCKTVLNTLVKRAYGDKSKICIHKINYTLNGRYLSYYRIILNIGNQEYVMFGYHDLVAETVFDVYIEEPFSYKNLLFEMMVFVKTPNSCISYLPDKPNLIDSSTSLEEVLVNLELTDIE